MIALRAIASLWALRCTAWVTPPPHSRNFSQWQILSEDPAITSKIRTTSLLRRGLWLEYVTLGWNVVGAVVTLIAAAQAGSAALAGFGLDSAVEILASMVVVWRLTGGRKARKFNTQTYRQGSCRAGHLRLRPVNLDWTLSANAHPAL